MNKYYFSLFLLFIQLTTLSAQLSEYNFDNNINDQVNSNDAIYIINGNSTSMTPNYVNNSATDQILLDPIQGLQFPQSLIDAVDTSQSLEISFTFTITDLGPGEGTTDLWTCSAYINDPGFSMFIRHYEFSGIDDYQIVFSFSDGGLNQEVPNHPGHDETNIGYALVGDVVDVKLILDFENNNWTSIVNGNYISKTFDQGYEYDWEVLMESVKNNNWYFGWHEGQDSDMDSDPGIWTSTLSMDELSFFSPRQAGNTSIVVSALQAMTAHVDGSNPLSLAQRNTHLNELYLNYFNNHDLVSSEVFDYLSAYENNYPPVYSNRGPVVITSLEPESQLLVFLQQSIFDNEYTLDNVSNLTGIVYEFSEIFPGPVADNAVRVNNATVEINGTHTYDPAARVVVDIGNVKRPMGYYAPPGEIVTIEIPANMVNEGLSIMIGAHEDDHSSLSETNRFNRISKTYPLTTASTEIISPFGGALYLKVPINTQLGWFDVNLSGAVKSPYFSWRNGRETDPSVWAAELSEHAVEWVDLESDKYMMTLPLAHVSSLTDPTNLMMQWDEIMAGFRYVGGRPNPRPRAEYFAIDSRLPDDGFGTGYPQIIGEDSSPFGPFNAAQYYPTHVLNSDFWDSDFNVTFHEMGHAVLHPTLIDEVESIVHIPAVYVYNQLYGLSFDEAFKYSSQEFLLLNEAAMDWMIAFNFRNNNEMGCDPTMEDFVCDELRYQHRGFAKYVAMAKLLGWETVYNMNNVFYNEWTANGVDNFEVNKDNILRAASEANGVNMAPLFHFWGHPPSASLKDDLDLLPPSPEIYNQLIEYYNVIPATQADFLSWRDLLLNWKDPVHHDRINEAYDNYDLENYAQQMQDQICNVLNIYFPNNAFCNQSIGFNFQPTLLLEGPYIGGGLMSNNLLQQIPLNQPYALPPYNYNGTESLTDIPSNMVDWILIEARSGTPNTFGNRATVTEETKVGILLADGSVLGVDGNPVVFENLLMDVPYHFCIRHRNHLDILTATPILASENMFYDFTNNASQALGTNQLKVQNDGVATLFAGEYNSDGVIQTTDFDQWQFNPAILNTYSATDGNLDGTVQTTDYDIWFINKAKVGIVEIGF